MQDRSVFEEVAHALRGLVPGHLGELRCPHHRYGIKVWFGPEKAPREHYEAQIVGRQYAPEASALALELGFHSEHASEADNESAVAGLLQSERAWRRKLGKDPVVGPFLGRE